MNAVVVDTDVVSLIFKGDSRAEKYLSVLSGPDLLVSRLSGDQSEIVRFRAYMRRFVSVPSSRDLIVKWAEAMVEARSQGRRIDVADAWIAATALLYDAPLVTNNPDDYLGVATIKLLPGE